MNPPMKSTALVLAALALPVAPASAAVGDWGQGQRAEVRLISSGIGKDGKLAAGIEIVLPKGWTTYWRNPGDAGIPPLIDFSTSKNVGAADVSFPVPMRVDDGADTVTNVYRDHVLLPVSVAVTDPAKSVDLSLDLKLGVCDQICVPDDVSVTLTVPPGDNDATAAAELATARALVPGAAEPGVFALDRVTRDGGIDSHPVFRFAGVVPDAAHADVFIEGPADWAPYTPEFSAAGDKATWSVKFSRTGSKIPIPGAEFRVTIRSAGRAIDQTLGLD
jgi:DsbC/DsbD-like thiol-disulfide interchange protein